MPPSLSLLARRLYARARFGQSLRTPALADYQPRSSLTIPAHHTPRAAVPAIDVHNHIGRWLSRDGGWMQPDVDGLLAQMAAVNIRALVNLDGRWGSELEQNLDRYDRAHPECFATFCHVDWQLVGEDRFDALPDSLLASVAVGARGLKVWKDLGRSVRDRQGRLVLPDDVRLGGLWEAAASAQIPVLIHVADPVAHFARVDRHNERFEELHRFPGASWFGRGFPAHERLMIALRTLLAAHPNTTFIGAHMAGWSENLGWVDELLTAHPNLYVDISARVGDLGRQPRATAGLIARHPQRVLFGTDVYPFRPNEIEIYFRFLETADEAFPYSMADPPPRGRWDIGGIELDAATLAAVYAGNAERLVPVLRAKPSA
jgi:hypothetical protein